MMITVDNNKSKNKPNSLANASRAHLTSEIDRYLIEQIECGCQNSMKTLYHKYYVSLTSLIKICLISGQDKAKVLHNSFLDIWSGRQIWDRRQSVKVFIFSIVERKINTFNEEIRRTLNQENDIKAYMGENDLFAKVSDLQHQLSYLSPAHRGLLFLIYKENLSYEQIAIIENCSVDSVKNQFLDLLKRLKPPST